MADCHHIHSFHGAVRGGAAAAAPHTTTLSAGASLYSLSPRSHAIAKKTSHPPPTHVDVHCSCEEDVSPEVGRYEGCKAASAGSSVRVVQIYNPVLVKTDVANFRSLVQRLTGKSGCSLKYWNKLRKLNAMAFLEAAELVDRDGDQESFTIDATPLSATVDDEGEEQLMPDSSSPGSSSAFSDLDIHAALVSDGPLPDITMLPPLQITSTFPNHSLCT